MKLFSGITAIVLGIVTFFFYPSLASTGGEIKTHDKSKEEILNVFEDYIHYFMAGEANNIANKIFNAPVYVLSDNQNIILQTPMDVEKHYQKALSRLFSMGYSHSDILFLNVCVLNPSSALVNAGFIRRREDGTELMRRAGTFTFHKGDSGWRAVSVIGQSTHHQVLCLSDTPS